MSNLFHKLKPVVTALLFLTAGLYIGFTQETDDEFAEEFGDDEFTDETENEVGGIYLNGFIEYEQGGRIGTEGNYNDKWIMGNSRVRLSISHLSEANSFYLKLDFIDDWVIQAQRVNIREARIAFSPLTSMDMSIGKQVSTWGVADMLFINDLFPKNWVANFLGQDIEDMKETALSIRMTSYFDNAGFDVVYHPKFTPDITPTGCRFSVYNPNNMIDPTQPVLITGADDCRQEFTTYPPRNDYASGELAFRLFSNIGSHGLAFYGYRGFFKNPKGLKLREDGIFETFYPKLNVYGVSAEGQAGIGVYTAEYGYYESSEDKGGEFPLIENSLHKFLVGYRLDVSKNVSSGVQWYMEQMDQYEEFEEGLLHMLSNQLIADGISENDAEDIALEQDVYKYRKEEFHNTFTLRITFKAQQETLWMNFFLYARPQDRDGFVKLDIRKRLDDHFEVITGVNIFHGDHNFPDREFSMLKNDDNAFFRLKYYF